MEVMSHDTASAVFEMDLVESHPSPMPSHKPSHPNVPCSPYPQGEPNVQEEDVQGLTYPPSFLTSLPVLHPPVQRYDTAPPPSPSPSPASSSSSSPAPQPHPHSCRANTTQRNKSRPQPPHSAGGPPPIRALNAAQFAAVHARYATTHAPDGVLFPFLHGLEGENDLQNSFFAGSSSSLALSDGEDDEDRKGRRRNVPRVPRFRGLVWVASDEDDVEAYERAMRARQHSEFDDDEDDLSDEEYSSSEASDGVDMDMDLDGPACSTGVNVVGMDVDGEETGPASAERGITAQPGVVDLTDHDEGDHMHPIMGRRPALSAIDTSKEQIAHGHRLSNASSTSSFSSEDPSPSLASPSPDSALPTPPTPPSSLPEDEKTLDARAIVQEQAKHRSPIPERVTLTSTFKPRELLCIDRATGETRFIEPRVPEGISLRNFGIQVPIFATLSDIVVYSPRGNAKAALAVATHFAHAIESKRAERAARGQTDLLYYNVFVLHASPEEMVKEMPTVVARMADEVVGAHTQGTEAQTTSETHVADAHASSTSTQERQQEMWLHHANTISFAQREKDEMRELTQASEILTLPTDDDSSLEFSASSTKTRWDASRGQVFLGNASDVPNPVPSQAEWDYSSNDPARGLGFDFCIECDDMAPFPTTAHMHAAEEHIAKLEKKWQDHCLQEFVKDGEEGKDWDQPIPLRPPPPANLVVHLPFPSSVTYASNSVLPYIAWLESLLRPAERVTFRELRDRRDQEAEQRRVSAARPVARRSTNAGHAYPYHNQHYQQHPHGQFGGPSSLPPPTAFPSSFLPTQGSAPAASYTRMRSTSATHLSSPPPGHAPAPPALRTRPLKMLIFSADGYTESSSLALCILMTLRKLSLPEAYLELQNEKRRSFFVYPTELTPLKRIEARLERAAAGTPSRMGRPSAQSVSFASGTELGKFLLSGRHNQPEEELSASAPTSEGVVRRPRANTLPPPLSSPSDHQIWFNDPRFDGSFPSRVLPFLYLGNLNHAANAYMLHALGITHVVSVGECALIPPEHASTNHGAFQAGLATAKPGSLWIEEREGRIKVLDIKGVCDDGIDSLEPQLPPICEWIDEARKAGGKVLVHCRVGVSRSATVTIAYVMKHLNIPLVDAYLIVRSRRLSVLIQPNMRLLYNLLGWEIKLAQERAQGDEKKLHEELARALNWPYLAKEVHLLNEKYLH